MSTAKSESSTLAKFVRQGSIVAGSLILTVSAISWLQSNLVPPNDSDAVAHVFFNEQYSSVKTFKWTDNVIASASATELSAPFVCPSQSNQVFTFLSNPGDERKGPQFWAAFGYAAFTASSTEVREPNLKPSGLTDGIPGSQAIRAKGGAYSLGIACGTDSVFDWVAYRTIRLGANSDTFTFDDEPKLEARND
jgi:hypothetical protein